MVRDLSDLVPGLSTTPQSTGPGTFRPDVQPVAEGSASVNAYAMTEADNVPAPDAGARTDYAHLLGESGARESRPGDSGGWREAGGYDPPGPWGRA
jgi:hypothetical protein